MLPLESSLYLLPFFVIIYCGVGLFGFIFFGAFCASCSGHLLLSLVWEDFSHKFSSGMFSVLFSSSQFPIMCRLACFTLSCGSPYIALIFFHLGFFCCSNWVISIILSSRSSSALFILLFIAFSSAFISSNEFSNFSGLFTASSSFYSNLHFYW